ncbi:MAG TPA: NAD kinase [Flavobacteriaceae bacterium]|nr:NAD kinase [Flavobacteriaceae bacterium]MCB9212317.1 NAD kinase [Alteromonas sp.]HPF12476.1 NAD kinase [Flavobacteriaceae bacterium]HQU22265.1 NAD kinase [Flavobacteriaceae bacterium]HQU65202.1 NAD kinase [Flavobacteriaceae bacterium]
MKIGIYGQFYHKESEKYIQKILEALRKKGAEVYIEKGFRQIIEQHGGIDTPLGSLKTFTNLDRSYDFFFSVGGDGTLLKSVTFVRDLDIPIVGINTGNLGFLSTIQKEKISESIHNIMDGRYYLSERSLLSVATQPQKDSAFPLDFALNEIAVNRKNTTSMIKVETWVNDEHLTSYWSDGLIVSTPTGSTGYSLSCGGPVIDPQSNSMVLTPIAPHNLNARPLVIPDSSKVRLKVYGREENYLMSLDSRIATLQNETEIFISKAPFTVKMLQMEGDSFIKTLRAKLLWGEDRRN